MANEIHYYHPGQGWRKVAAKAPAQAKRSDSHCGRFQGMGIAFNSQKKVLMEKCSGERAARWLSPKIATREAGGSHLSVSFYFLVFVTTN